MCLTLLLAPATLAQEARFDNGRALNKTPSPEVEILVKRGVQLGLDDRLEEAQALLQQALKLDPNYLRAHIEYRNVVINFLGQADRINAEYASLLKSDPDNPVYLMAIYHFSDGNYGRAELQKVSRLAPEWAWGHYATALLALADDPSQAVIQFRECIKKDPFAIEAYDRLVELQETRLQRVDEAIATAEAYANTPALRARGLPVLWRLRLKQAHSADTAKTDLRQQLKVLSAETSDIALLSTIRDAYRNLLNDREAAAEIANQLRRIDPAWYEMRGWRFSKVAHNESGVPRFVMFANRQLELYNKSKEPIASPEQTIERLEQLLSERPHPELARLIYEDIFRASIKAKDLSSMFKYGELLLRLDPSDGVVWARMASTLADRNVMLARAEGYARRAVTATDYFRLLTSAPNMPGEIFTKFFSPEKQHDVYQLNRALALDALGWVQYQKRQYRLAVQTLRWSFAVKPTTASRSHLLAALGKLGRADEAAILSASAARDLERVVAERLIDKVVAEVELTSADNTKFFLSSLKGQVLLLSFWATWCEPCREELPSLVELARKFGPSKLRVVLIPMDDDAAKVRKFLKNSRVELETLTAPAAPESFGTSMIPTNIIIDTTGKMRYRKVGSTIDDTQEFEVVVKRLLRESPSK